MSQTVVTVDVGGTGANNANAALTNLGALPTFGGSITGNLNVSNNIVVTGNANLGSFILNGNTILTTLTGAYGDIVLVPNADGKLLVQSQGLFGNVNGYPAETYFFSAGIDGSTVALGSVADSNGAAELLIVNKNSGTLAYSEMIAINDVGDQDSGWISVGVNSSNYDDPDYTLTGPDDGYLLFEAPQGTTANGDLIVATGSYGLNNKIVMAAGGFTPTDAQLIIAPADLKRANLTSYIVASNVVTFTTDITHTFVANDIVAISDVGAPYDGTRTITDVSSNTFNVSVTVSDVGPVNLSPAGFALQFLPFNKGTVELTAQLFVGENSRSTIETADITLIQGHAIPLGIVVDNDGPGQTVMFNKSNGTLSYSEFIAHNDAGNVEMGWISMGINSSGYDDPEFPITKADDAYLLYEPPLDTAGDGDLIIGTGTNGQKNRLIFAAEGFDEANAQMIITPNESVRISIPTDASSANTGALQVVGGIGVQGSMYVQGNQTIQGDLIVNGSQVIQSIENLAAAGPISLLSDGNIANTWDQGVVGTYAIPKSANTQSVILKSIANNTGTLVTSGNHIYVAEDYATIGNVDATFNGTHRITSVTANSISFFLLANNLSQTAASGDVTVDKAARYTGVVKRATDGNWRFFSGLGSRPAFNTDFADANLEFDSIIAGNGDFRGTLKLGTPNTATISYTDANNRAFTIPAVGGNRTFAFIDQAQTFTAAQAVSSTVTATKFIPTAGDATGNGLYLSGANKLGLTADGVERVSISASETVINDGSADYDFRVESDGNANMLFVDGGNNRVGIGTGAPEQTLHVQGNGYVSGNVGIGTSSPGARLNPVVSYVSGTIVTAIKLSTVGGYDSGSGTAIDFGQDQGTYSTWVTGRIASPRTGSNWGGSLTFSTNDDSGATGLVERMRIDSSGRLLVGDTTARTVLTKTIELSGAGTGVLQPSYLAYSYVSAGHPTNTGYIQFLRSGSGTLGTNSIVASGDRLGMVRFSGANGTDWTPAAEIYGEVDGTPGASSDMPGRLVFATTSDGAGSTTERMRITSGGNVGIGTTSPTQKLDVEGDIRIGGGARSLFFKRFGDNYAWRIRNESSNDSTTYGFNGTNKLVFEVVVDSNTNATPGNTSHNIYASSENTLVLTEEGRVGIGTLTPAYKLDVNGTANINKVRIPEDLHAFSFLLMGA